jgi:hypothetical protein
MATLAWNIQDDRRDASDLNMFRQSAATACKNSPSTYSVDGRISHGEHDCNFSFTYSTGYKADSKGF